MSNIRWNNVAAPNVGDIGSLLRGASASVNSGLSQFQDMIKQSWLRDEEAKKQKEAEMVDQFKAGMTANLDPEAVRSGIESGQYQDMISGMDVSTATKSKLRDSLLPFLSNAEAFQSNKRKAVDEVKALEEKAQMESMLPAVRTLEAAAMSANPQARKEALEAGTAISDRMPDPTKFIKSLRGLVSEGERQEVDEQLQTGRSLIQDAVAQRDAIKTSNQAILENLTKRGMTVPVDAAGNPDLSQIDPLVRNGLTTTPSDTELFGSLQKRLLNLNPKVAKQLEDELKAVVSTAEPGLVGADAQTRQRAEQAKVEEVTAAKNAYDMVESMAKRQANSLGFRSLATLEDADGTSEIEAGFADAGMGATAKDGDALDKRGYIQKEIAKLKKTPEGRLIPASVIADIIRTIPQEPDWINYDSEVGDRFKLAVQEYLEKFGKVGKSGSLADQFQLLRNNVRASQNNYEQKLSKYGYTETGKK